MKFKERCNDSIKKTIQKGEKIMKFKDFLDEKYVADGRRKEWELMMSGFMPLSPSILKDSEIFIPEAYHVTSIKYVSNVVKLQGKMVDLPTFTKGSEGISRGAFEKAEVLFKLSGYSSFSALKDFNSDLDRNGHRWLNPWNNKVVDKKFSKKIYKEIIKEYNLDDIYDIPSLVNGMDNKEKYKFVKFYYDKSKKIITKSLIIEIQESISKNHTGSFDNNEILLHNFKVLELLVINDGPDEYGAEDNIQRILDMDVIGVDGTIKRNKIIKVGKK